VERPINLVDEVEYQLVTAKRSRGGVVARSRLLGRDVLTKTQFLIERDDFLMSNRQIIHGGCGIVPPALDGAVVSNEYSVLRPNSKLSLEFLGYLSHSIYFQQTCFHASVGVDVGKMIFDCERWQEFKIHVPPLYEQRRIAEILSTVDDAIAATRAVIEQTRKVKRRVLECLLTKGIGHARFKQTEIGEIPEGWEVVELIDASEAVTVGIASSATHAYRASEPRRVCRRPQLVRSRVYDKQDDEQILS
jgi:type I restriction enzyme S subunit